MNQKNKKIILSNLRTIQETQEQQDPNDFEFYP